MAPPSVTLAVLTARARERADMVGSTFVTDAATSMWAFANEGCQRLHEKLVEAYGENYVESSASISMVNGTSDYALPDDFFKLYGFQMPVNGKVSVLKPYMHGERAGYANIIQANGTPRYKLAGLNVRFLPATNTATVTISYAPIFTLLTSGSSTVSFPNGWERYVVLYMAIQAMLKEESDVSGLRAELNLMDKEIDQAKMDRDAAFPRHAVDMDMADYEGNW